MESTVRFAAELGYEVMMVKDATASFTDDQMHAALHINIPNYASAIVTTNEVVDSISSLEALSQWCYGCSSSHTNAEWLPGAETNRGPLQFFAE